MSRDDQKLKTTHTADDLISVTVRKDEDNQGKKAGIALVERKGAILVTKIAPDGLFHNTDVGVGDVVLSLNGKRIRKNQAPADIVKAITRSKATVTMVIKKADRKARRGVRSLSPTKQRKMQREKDRQKNYKGLRRRNPDGSLKLFNPKDNAWAKESDDYDQMTIVATKLFAKQACGVHFQESEGMVFVGHITQDSIFLDTELEVGDRILQINEMNFREYATKIYAKKILERSPDDVELIVEKGRQNLEGSMSSLQSVNYEEEEEKNMNASFSRKLRILKSPGRKMTESDHETDKSDDDGDDDTWTLEDLKHDFLRIRWKHRDPNGESGLKFIRRGGKMYVKSLPENERRFTIGDEVLAINRTKARKIMTSESAEAMIEKSEDDAIILINYDDPRTRKITCPSCGELMKADGTIHASQHNPLENNSGRAGRTAKVTNLEPESKPTAAAATTTTGTKQVRRGRSGYDAARSRRGREPPVQTKYNLQEYASESESDSDSGSDSSSGSGSSGSDSSSSGSDSEASEHKPNEKFLVSVKKTRKKAPGIRFLAYKGELFVSALSEAGLFHDTAVKAGDQVLSVNGKKTSGMSDASFVEDIIDEKDLISIYFKRLDHNSGIGKEVLQQLV
eukprot:CAMPEP_0119562282 /NCGR_PEP_ID=MMETSP1352-20130426/19963_1 /TAXON_ID=265584 /ORGANISM="Stauroneis constricta, Strain CCMP1120" /LENGTH=623 /DNA_ID=CAMNT_0007610643 /DNA_START=40 /DNA_END=1911 /DNA_ORIENTATION=-